ncbi:MAG: hypothetical protein QW331_03015 [Candidatus Woesearchaeota archaeon]
MNEYIIPAIIAINQKELDRKINLVKKFASRIQIDVMDKKFVPTHSCDFNFKLKKFPYYEAHLMVLDPFSWIKKHGKKFNCILIHYESKQIDKCIKEVKKMKKEVGIAINPETPVSKLIPYLDKINRVQVMTVYPGWYGAKFLPWTLKKVNQLRKMKSDLDIEVDGHITDKTIVQAKNAGANMFGVGSFIMQSKHPKKAYLLLKKS